MSRWTRWPHWMLLGWAHTQEHSNDLRQKLRWLWWDHAMCFQTHTWCGLCYDGLPWTDTHIAILTSQDRMTTADMLRKINNFFCVTVPAESSPEVGTATLGNNYCNTCSLSLALRQCHSSHAQPFLLPCRMRSNPARPPRAARLWSAVGVWLCKCCTTLWESLALPGT